MGLHGLSTGPAHSPGRARPWPSSALLLQPTSLNSAPISAWAHGMMDWAFRVAAETGR
jgi:hypothetical protein